MKSRAKSFQFHGFNNKFVSVAPTPAFILRTPALAFIASPIYVNTPRNTPWLTSITNRSWVSVLANLVVEVQIEGAKI